MRQSQPVDIKPEDHRKERGYQTVVARLRLGSRPNLAAAVKRYAFDAARNRIAAPDAAAGKIEFFENAPTDLAARDP